MPHHKRRNPRMRNIPHKTSYMASALALVLVLSLVLAACASQPSSIGVQIVWVDFIRFAGITYTTSPVDAGHALNAGDLRSVFATVSFNLQGNVQVPGSPIKNGNAAF